MKKTLLFLVAAVTFTFGATEGNKIIKTVEDATNSNNSVEVNISDEDRPSGFIIKRSKEEIKPVAVVVDNDTDKDGVTNDKDKCPNTPAGKVVDEYGCIKLIRLHVRFAYDKYDITKEYASQIQKAVDFQQENSSFTISVDGHTDSDGSVAYNQGLSERRANAVKQRLNELGVEDEKIVAKGYGELKPVVPNDSDKNKAMNRRVDISFNR